MPLLPLQDAPGDALVGRVAVPLEGVPVVLRARGARGGLVRAQERLFGGRGRELRCGRGLRGLRLGRRVQLPRRGHASLRGRRGARGRDRCRRILRGDARAASESAARPVGPCCVARRGATPPGMRSARDGSPEALLLLLLASPRPSPLVSLLLLPQRLLLRFLDALRLCRCATPGGRPGRRFAPAPERKDAIYTSIPAQRSGRGSDGGSCAPQTSQLLIPSHAHLSGSAGAPPRSSGRTRPGRCGSCRRGSGGRYSRASAPRLGSPGVSPAQGRPARLADRQPGQEARGRGHIVASRARQRQRPTGSRARRGAVAALAVQEAHLAGRGRDAPGGSTRCTLLSGSTWSDSARDTTGSKWGTLRPSRSPRRPPPAGHGAGAGARGSAISASPVTRRAPGASDAAVCCAGSEVQGRARPDVTGGHGSQAGASDEPRHRQRNLGTANWGCARRGPACTTRREGTCSLGPRPSAPGRGSTERASS